MLLAYPITIPPGRIPESRSVESKAFMYGHSADLALAGFEFRVVESTSMDNYRRIQEALWVEGRTRDGFMVVEQDVIPPSVSYLEEMARCPELMCVAPVEDHGNFQFHPYHYDGSPWTCSVGTPDCRPGPSMGTWNDIAKPNGGTRPVRPGDEWCNISGTGIFKVSKRLCGLNLTFKDGIDGLDTRLYAFLQNGTIWRKTHIHWPPNFGLVQHRHLFCRKGPDDWPNPRGG